MAHASAIRLFMKILRPPLCFVHASIADTFLFRVPTSEDFGTIELFQFNKMMCSEIKGS